MMYTLLIACWLYVQYIRMRSRKHTFFIVTWVFLIFSSFSGTIWMPSIPGTLCIPATYYQKLRSCFSKSLKVFLIGDTLLTGAMLCPSILRTSLTILFMTIQTQKPLLPSVILNFWMQSHASLLMSRLLRPHWPHSHLPNFLRHVLHQLLMIRTKTWFLSDDWALTALRAHTMFQYLAWEILTTSHFPWGEIPSIHFVHPLTPICCFVLWVHYNETS